MHREENPQSSPWNIGEFPQIYLRLLQMNWKLVSGEVHKLLFSVVKIEINSRHNNILHRLL